jgi:hypothetical protein
VICSLFSPLQALSLAIASKLLGFDFEFGGEGRGGELWGFWREESREKNLKKSLSVCRE